MPVKSKFLWLSWLYLFVQCGVLGLIPEPSGLVKWLLVALAVCFFIPGFVLLVKADHRDDEKTIRLIRNISLVALVMATLLIMFNYLTTIMTASWGIVAHWMLVFLASPMVCGQYWVVGLFGWASLMVDAVMLMQKRN